MACDMAEQERLWTLVEIISTGQMPEGHTEDELLAMGLPLPGELYREAQPDGTVVIKQHPPSMIEALRKAKGAAAKNKNAFVCDTPRDD